MASLPTGLPGSEDHASSFPEGQVDLVSVSLHAETVQIRKRRIEELMSVQRATRTKSVLVEEPLRTEGVIVEHVLVGEFVDASPPVREEGDTIIIPIVEEIAVVVKRLYLGKGVRITRTRTTLRHVETIMLREQHAQVTRTPTFTGANAQRALPALINLEKGQ